MPGPSAKDPSTRQRRNRTSTSKTLHVVDPADVTIPDLPDTAMGGERWLPSTEEWWVAVWSSPMSGEYTDSDYYGILALAQLWDARERMFVLGGITAALSLSTEIRLAQKDYGFTPNDRRRLQWTVEQGESAARRTEGRRRDEQERQPPAPVKEGVVDPRTVLHSVN